MSLRFFVRRETHEYSILTRPRLTEKKFCDCCGADVRWLFPEEAMFLAEVSLRRIFRLVEAREIHFLENPQGFLLVCAESLATKKAEK